MATASKASATVSGPAGRRSYGQGAIPAYGVADGVQSWRHGLRARERAVVDRALAILGTRLAGARDVLDCPDTVCSYLTLRLAGDPCERFAVIYLDTQHAAIAYECHFTGTIAQANVYPREIVHAALKHQAAAVVLAHNHPSGGLKPSRADEMLTQTLKHALALIDVRVLDHIIVAGVKSFSMASHGMV